MRDFFRLLSRPGRTMHSGDNAENAPEKWFALRCHNRNVKLQKSNAPSLNDPIRPRQDLRRHRQANLLGCSQIDDELKLGGLLNREVGGFRAF